MVLRPISPSKVGCAGEGNADEAKAPGTETPVDANREVAVYIAHMTTEMAAMARTSGYEMLAYFLDMARIEARIQADSRKT